MGEDQEQTMTQGSDLISRLRVPGPLEATRLEAADEIERLQAVLRKVKEYLDDMNDHPEPGDTIKMIEDAINALHSHRNCEQSARRESQANRNDIITECAEAVRRLLKEDYETAQLASITEGYITDARRRAYRDAIGAILALRGD